MSHAGLEIEKRKEVAIFPQKVTVAAYVTLSHDCANKLFVLIIVYEYVFVQFTGVLG